MMVTKAYIIQSWPVPETKLMDDDAEELGETGVNIIGDIRTV